MKIKEPILIILLYLLRQIVYRLIFYFRDLQVLAKLFFIKLYTTIFD